MICFLPTEGENTSQLIKKIKGYISRQILTDNIFFESDNFRRNTYKCIGIRQTLAKIHILLYKLEKFYCLKQ